jgi:glutathione peroxidase-family protein
MKTSRLVLSLLAAFGAAAFVQGQPAPSAKTPVDLAAESFFKLTDDRTAKPDEARFAKIIGSGIEFLMTTPEHKRSPDVVFALAMYGLTMTDPKLAPYRIAYAGKLSAAIVDFRYKPELSPAAKTACAALDAGVRDYEARMQLNRETLRALREKIDELAPLADSNRYLAEREGSYVELVMKSQGPAAGERHLKKLADHRDSAVALMARENLNIIEVSKTPYQLKFTAFDGKECDFEKLRGKMVAVLFWNSAEETSAKSLAALKAAHTKYAANGFEVISVSLDKAEDREAVKKFLADKKVAWPTHFDGTGVKNEWVAKLNVHAAPQLALFDQKGMLLTNNARFDRLDEDLKKLLNVKEADKNWTPESTGKKRI